MADKVMAEKVTTVKEHERHKPVDLEEEVLKLIKEEPDRT